MNPFHLDSFYNRKNETSKNKKRNEQNFSLFASCFLFASGYNKR